MTQKLPSADHHTTLSGWIFAIQACIDSRKKKLVNISSTCPHSMANFGSLVTEIGSAVWGTTTSFNGFCVLASLLQRCRSLEANQTLYTMSGQLLGWYTIYHYIYIFGGSCPQMEFCPGEIHFASKSCIRLCWHRYCTALQQRPSAKLCGVVQGMELRNFRRGRHLYLAGRPWRWASVHMLVSSVSKN